MKYTFLILFTLSSVAISATVREVTLDQQAKGSDADVELTRRIREKLVKDDALSVYAHNITIVTLGKTVTLKGEVETKAEGQRVAGMVREMSGKKTVNNELIYKR